MSIGANELLKDYKGNRLAVAEALLRGEINDFRQEYIDELVDLIILEAAKFRVLNEEFLSKKK